MCTPVNRPRVLFVGRATLDVLYRLERYPDEDTKTFAQALHASPGGPATNAAITHALLGGEALLMAAVGDGLWTDVIRAETERHGIRLIDLAEGTSYTAPLTTVLVSTGAATRTIVNPPVSTVALRRPATWDREWGQMPELILCDGFHLAEVLPFLAACRSAGARICLDGGSWKPGTEQLAGLLDVAICGERFTVPEYPPDPENSLGWFQRQGVPYVAVTRGARSILGSDQGRRFAIDVQPIEAADTNGAGDVLHGAFCYEFSRDGQFEAALRFAAQIASRSCTGFGIGAWCTESTKENGG